MSSNEELVHRFYTAFQQLDFKTMQDCYAEDAIFSDPAFGVLHGDEVRSMWEMLCKRAKDFKLEFSNIQSLDEEYLTCNWTASYLFSQTGRNIVNRAKAYMRISDGKISEHSDAFKLSNWLGQAFGWKGKLLGWSGYMKSKVRSNARKGLELFMKRNSRPA